MDLTHNKCKIFHSIGFATSNIPLLMNFQVVSRISYCYFTLLFYHNIKAKKIHVHAYILIILFQWHKFLKKRCRAWEHVIFLVVKDDGRWFTPKICNRSCFSQKCIRMCLPISLKILASPVGKREHLAVI